MANAISYFYPEDIVVSVDIEDAYMHIPSLPVYQPYLCLHWAHNISDLSPFPLVCQLQLGSSLKY